MTPIKTHQCFDGVQELYRFDNGFGASVVRHMHSYGGPDGFWELGVISWEKNKYRDWETDRKSTRLNSSHSAKSRMPSSA